LDLRLNLALFEPGNLFDFLLFVTNDLGQVSCDLYILLDVWGEYFFWPAWLQELAYEQRSYGNGPTSETILQFIWPAGAGSASGIRFYGAFFRPGTYDLMSYDMVEFAFSETYPTPPPVSPTPPVGTPTPSATPITPATPTQAPFVITVPGIIQWTNTGITVQAGEEWIIEASGTICFHAGDCAGTTVGPCGTGGSTPCYDPECGTGQPYEPGFYHGALIARIGPSGSVFLICEYYQRQVSASGELYLGINDANVSDNDGAFTAVLMPGTW